MTDHILIDAVCYSDAKLGHFHCHKWVSLASEISAECKSVIQILAEVSKKKRSQTFNL